jgi:hypothetical protein
MSAIVPLLGARQRGIGFRLLIHCRSRIASRTLKFRSQIQEEGIPFNPATFQPFGGHYIIHFGKTVSFDGRPPNRFVVIA